MYLYEINQIRNVRAYSNAQILKYDEWVVRFEELNWLLKKLEVAEEAKKPVISKLVDAEPNSKIV